MVNIGELKRIYEAYKALGVLLANAEEAVSEYIDHLELTESDGPMRKTRERVFDINHRELMNFAHSEDLRINYSKTNIGGLSSLPTEFPNITTKEQKQIDRDDRDRAARRALQDLPPIIVKYGDPVQHSGVHLSINQVAPHPSELGIKDTSENAPEKAHYCCTTKSQIKDELKFHAGGETNTTSQCGARDRRDSSSVKIKEYNLHDVGSVMDLLTTIDGFYDVRQSLLGGWSTDSIFYRERGLEPNAEIEAIRAEINSAAADRDCILHQVYGGIGGYIDEVTATGLAVNKTVGILSFFTIVVKQYLNINGINSYSYRKVDNDGEYPTAVPEMEKLIPDEKTRLAVIKFFTRFGLSDDDITARLIVAAARSVVFSYKFGVNRSGRISTEHNIEIGGSVNDGAITTKNRIILEALAGFGLHPRGFASAVSIHDVLFERVAVMIEVTNVITNVLWRKNPRALVFKQSVTISPVETLVVIDQLRYIASVMISNVVNKASECESIEFFKTEEFSAFLNDTIDKAIENYITISDKAAK